MRTGPFTNAEQGLLSFFSGSQRLNVDQLSS